MKIRSFAAIELPAEIIEAYRRYVRSAADRWPYARWTDPANLHLTVCFFGEVEEPVLARLTDGLNLATRTTAPFFLEHRSVVLAPTGRTPATMIWSVFGGSDDYALLAGKVRAAATPYAPEMPAAKEIIPHVTLARLRRDGFTRSLTPAPDQIEPPPGPFPVKGIRLLRSRLSSSGPSYDVIERLNFANLK